jgi:CRISPR-associated endonuclease/helicase Cas3
VLLAKSKPQLCLEKHLRDTEEAATAIFTGRILDNWCRFFGTDPTRLLLHVRIASLFHDIGKANEEFQKICGDHKRLTQTLRHEWLSALILHLPVMRLWLSQSSDLDFEVVVAAVLGHHMKADDQWAETCQTEIRKLALALNYNQVTSILKIIQAILKLDSDVPQLPETWEWEDHQWIASRKDGRLSGKKIFRNSIRSDHTRRALHLAVKAGVVVSDTAASGYVRECESIQKSIPKWIKEHLHRHDLTIGDIDRDILNPKYQKLGKSFDDLHGFQKQAIHLGDLALLRAGCGQGKTLAAYLWVRGVIQRGKYKIGRVLFLYPTRATATEGFKDYVQAAPESDAGLYHSTSDYELEKLFESPSESPDEKRDFRTNDRLFALGLWGKRYLSATVDRFLAFLSFNYGATVLLPMLADAAIVLDEIHAYDPRMFKQVIAFLQTFDVPVLCMTATLPKDRREQLEALGLELYPNNPEELEDLAKQEERKRYQIKICDDKVAKKVAIDAYRSGKRVLWVVNTVARCQERARELHQALKDMSASDVEILCYHSRFKLIDRQGHHEKVVDQFKQRDTPVIAVTTQVCEMSLDLDADVLVTEVAPCSALVQRFGRSNRHGLLEYSEVYVYKPEEAKSSKPYEEEQLNRADEFLQAVINFENGYASQKLLAEQLEIYGDQETRADGNAPFLTGGYFASSEPFRDIEAWTHDCILQQDVEEAIKRVEAKNSKWRELVLPVPNYVKTKELGSDSRLLKYLRIAPDQNYSKKIGFEA